MPSLRPVVMLLIFFCALLGLWFGSFRGLLLGAVIGFLLKSAVQALLTRVLRAIHGQFVESTFAVAGAVSKADGVVTPEEIDAVQQLFVRLSLSEQQIGPAKAAFNRGKSEDFDLDAEVAKFARLARRSPALRQTFLQVQMVTALADGRLHPAEHEMLLRVGRMLGLNDREVAQLEALLRYASQSVAGSSGPPPQQRLDNAYAVLGVEPAAGDDEIKRAYRQLISENHPDKLASKGLPEGMRALAEERAKDINGAYELVKRTRSSG